MVRHFDHLGVVEARCGPTDGDAFPAVIEVEDEHRPITAEAADEAAENVALMATVRAPAAASISAVGVRRGAGASAADVDRSNIEKVRRFPGGLRT